MYLFGSIVPIDYLMVGGIGFLFAWLTALMVMPAVHNRALRLAGQRQQDVPLSIKEMRAEKDQIRAGFAVATRELELRLEELRAKSVAHADALGKKNQLIERLKKELQAVDTALKETETREQALREELRAIRRDLSGKLDEAHAAFRESEARERTTKEELHETKRVLNARLADKEREIAALTRELTERAREVAVKDAVLAAAERNIAVVRSEIGRLAPAPLAPELSEQERAEHEQDISRAVVQIDAAARRVDSREHNTAARPAGYRPIFRTTH